MRALLRRFTTRKPVVVTAQVSYIPVDPPPPRITRRQHDPGPLWRCYGCLHWCADRLCCVCLEGKRP